VRIKGWKRGPPRWREYLFDDLPPEVRWRAEALLGGFHRRWGRNLPRWRNAILIEQARRLACYTVEELSAWGRSMLAKRGGYAVQHRYRLEGTHPTIRATHVRLLKQKYKKQVAEEAERRAKQGFLPRARRKLLPLF